MTPEQQIIHDWIGTVPTRAYKWDERLPKLYDHLNTKWFDGQLPHISQEFVCEFCEMPDETAGICIDPERAASVSTDFVKVRPGIGINSNLKCLSDHVKIALLHEMVHASGVQGHEADFQNAIGRLFVAGAYSTLL